jgi:hypothetical protein
MITSSDDLPPGHAKKAKDDKIFLKRTIGERARGVKKPG